MRLAFALPAAALTAAVTAQTIVVPNFPANYSATEAPSSTAYPWGRGNTQIRVQYIYDSTHFTSQGIVSPVLINNLRWRANGAAANAGYTYNAATVQLSTAAVDFLAPSTTFATNHGPDLATVYSGAVTVATGAGTTPNNWYVNIPVTPFLYDPTSGSDLCIDMAHDGTGPAVTTGPAHDCAFVAQDLTSRIYNLTNYLSPTGTIQQNVSLVMEVGYVPASGLFANFTANVTGGVTPLAVNFTDTSFSSDPGGITGWAWDLDGDSVIDSTAQNPSFVYNTCGTYNVSLTVTDATHPPNTMTKTAYIVTDLITANFTQQVIGPLTVQFTDTSSVPATTWAWDLNGDSIIDSNLQNPSFVYASPAPVNVTLTVTRLCSPPSTITKSVVPVQSISHNVAPNNGLSTGASVYFDLNITNPAGINISSMDVFGSVVNTPYTIEMLVKPGTYLGFEGTQAAWARAGTASGTSGATTTTASSSTFPQPIYLPAGLYGVKLQYIGVGPRYQTGTAQQTVTNGDLSLTVGSSRGTTVALPWGGSNIALRWWSGTLYYSTHNIGGGAGYGAFGPGCAGSMGVSQLSSNLPQLGSTLNVNLSNLPQSIAIMMIGFSNTASVFGPLPIDVTPFGAPGCFGRVSTDATAFLLGAGNTATWSFTIPADPTLSGLQLYNQGLVLDPGFNALGAVFSDAAGMILGL